MKKITFVFDPATEQEKLEELLERLDPKPDNHVALSKLESSTYSQSDCLACSLSDKQLKELIATLSENKVKLGLLPHPELIEGRKGYRINSSF